MAKRTHKQSASKQDAMTLQYRVAQRQSDTFRTLPADQQRVISKDIRALVKAQLARHASRVF